MKFGTYLPFEWWFSLRKGFEEVRGEKQTFFVLSFLISNHNFFKKIKLNFF